MNNDNLFAQIIAKPRGEMLVPFPIKHPVTNQEFQVPMWELTAEETLVCKTKAEKKTRVYLKDALPSKTDNDDTFSELNNKFLSAEILAIAVRHPDNSKQPFFLNSEQVLQLSITDMGILVNHYMDVIANSPALIGDAKLDEKAIKQWSQRVIEGGTQIPFLLNSFSLGAMKIFIMYLGEQLRTLQNQNSSSGKPVENITLE